MWKWTQQRKRMRQGCVGAKRKYLVYSRQRGTNRSHKNKEPKCLIKNMENSSYSKVVLVCSVMFRCNVIQTKPESRHKCRQVDPV